MGLSEVETNSPSPPWEFEGLAVDGDILEKLCRILRVNYGINYDLAIKKNHYPNRLIISLTFKSAPKRFDYLLVQDPLQLIKELLEATQNEMNELGVHRMTDKIENFLVARIQEAIESR